MPTTSRWRPRARSPPTATCSTPDERAAIDARARATAGSARRGTTPRRCGRRRGAQPRDRGVRRAAHGPRRPAGAHRPRDRHAACPMAEIVVLPHPELCPEGKTSRASRQVAVRQPARPRHRDRARLREVVRVHDVPRDRARGRRHARRRRPRTRTTCSTARGGSRRCRGCRARRSSQASKLVVEIPQYTINYAKEPR